MKPRALALRTQSDAVGREAPDQRCIALVGGREALRALL